MFQMGWRDVTCQVPIVAWRAIIKPCQSAPLIWIYSYKVHITSTYRSYKAALHCGLWYLPGRPMRSTHPSSESHRIKSKQLLSWPAAGKWTAAMLDGSLSGPTGDGRIWGRPGTVQSWSVHTKDRATQKRLLCAEQRERLFCLLTGGVCMSFNRWQSDHAFSRFVSRSSHLPFFCSCHQRKETA